MGHPIGWLERIQAAGCLAESVEPGPAIDCLEEELDAAIQRIAKRHNWLSYHTRNSKRSTAGWPDRVYCKPPKLLIVELKRESEEPTPAQMVWLAALRACGVDVRVWRPSDWPSIVATLTR